MNTYPPPPIIHTISFCPPLGKQKPRNARSEFVHIANWSNYANFWPCVQCPPPYCPTITSGTVLGSLKLKHALWLLLQVVICYRYENILRIRGGGYFIEAENSPKAASEKPQTMVSESRFTSFEDWCFLDSHFTASTVNRKQCMCIIFGTSGTVYLCYSRITREGRTSSKNHMTFQARGKLTGIYRDK